MPFLQYNRGPYTYGRNIWKFAPSDSVFSSAKSTILSSAAVVANPQGQKRVIPGTVLVFNDPNNQYVRPIVWGSDVASLSSIIAGVAVSDVDVTLADEPIAAIWRDADFLSGAIVGLTSGNVAALRTALPQCSFQ